MKLIKQKVKKTTNALSSVYQGALNGASYAGLATNLPAQSLTKKIWINIKKADNLKAADDNGLSDPYVMMGYLGCYWKSTKVIEKTLNPVWDTSFVIEVPIDEVLEFFIWDKDLISKESLGYVKIDLKDPSVFSRTGKAFQVEARPGRKPAGESGQLTVCVEWLTPSNVADLAPDDCDPKKLLAGCGALAVTVVSAKSLNPDASGKLDSYARAIFGKVAQKTKIVHGFLNPDWNQTFYFPLPKILPENLEIEIKDDNLIRGNVSLGIATLPLQSLTADQEFDSWLPLSNAKTGMVRIQATLHTNAFARESKSLVGVRTTKKVARSAGNKLLSTTKSAAGCVFVRLPIKIVVKACWLLRDRLKQRNYDGSVKGAIGFPTLRFGWNCKTDDTNVDQAHHVVHIETSPEDEEQERLLSKLVGLVVDRLLDIVKVMSRQMQEMNVSGALGARFRLAYLGPPTPGTNGLPTPIKFSLGLKVQSDSIPRPKGETAPPSPETDLLEVVRLDEQKKDFEKLANNNKSNLQMDNDEDENNSTLEFNAATTKLDALGALRVRVLDITLDLTQDEVSSSSSSSDEESKLSPRKEDKPEKQFFAGVNAGNNYLRTAPTAVGSNNNSNNNNQKKTILYSQELRFPLGPDGRPPPFLHLEVAEQKEEPSKYFLKRVFAHVGDYLNSPLLAETLFELRDLQPKKELTLVAPLVEPRKLLELRSDTSGEDAVSLLEDDEGVVIGRANVQVYYDPDSLPPPASGPKGAPSSKALAVSKATSAHVQKHGAIGTLLRLVARVMVHASCYFRRRCKERKFEGDICSYFKFGPFNTSFEISTDDSEAKIDRKIEQAFPTIEVEEIKKTEATVQKIVDGVTDLLLNGITIGCHEMQKKNIKGNVWFGQSLIIPGLPAELLLGLYINSDSAPSIHGPELPDINIDDLIAAQAEADSSDEEDNKKKKKKKKESGITGALEVLVVQAKDLNPPDPTDCSTYVKVSIGDDSLCTRDLDQGKNPAWNQPLLFPAASIQDLVSGRGGGVLSLKVYDDGVTYSQNSLGRANLELTEAILEATISPTNSSPKKAPFEVWLPLVDKKKNGGEPLAGSVRLLLRYLPDVIAPKIPSKKGFVQSVADSSSSAVGKSAKKTGKASVRLGFKVAILSARLARETIKDKGYKGKGMSKINAVMWQIGISLSSKDSEVNNPALIPKDEEKSSAVVRVLKACMEKVVDVLAVGSEEVQRQGTAGSLKVRATAALPPPLVQYFSVSTGLAVDTESVRDHITGRDNQAIKDSDKTFGIATRN